MTVLHTIGYAVADEPFDYAVPQEFAGAVRVVRVPAGRYPVQIRQSDSPYSSPCRYAGVSLEGTLTLNAWYGTNTRVERPDTPTQEFCQLYLYQCAQGFAGKSPRKDLRFELAEGYELDAECNLQHNGARLRVSGV